MKSSCSLPCRYCTTYTAKDLEHAWPVDAAVKRHRRRLVCSFLKSAPSHSAVHMPRLRPLRSLPRQRVLLPPARPPVSLPTASQVGRRTQFTEQERKYVLQQKSLGKTYQAIADEMRCGVSPIYRLCKGESGVPERPDYVLTSNDKLVISMFKEGRSLNSIARGFDRSFGAIWGHFHRYLVPSDPELTAKFATNPEIDTIVEKGLVLGKTAQQMARDSGQGIHVIKRHVWRYQTPAQRRTCKATVQDRQQVLQLRQAGKSANEVSLTQGFTSRMISKIVYEEMAKKEVPEDVRRLAAEGKDIIQIARKTDLSRILVKHFIRRLSKESVTPKQKAGRKMATRWTKPQRERLVALWDAGVKPKMMASKLEKPLDQVYRALWTWKDELTRPYITRSKKRWTEEEIYKVRSWKKSQMSLQEIATLLPGRSINGIRFLLRKYQE
ncbi:hypothetical protein AC579_8826 [Pseudocercospora musae]|uniref:Transposase IS30-like HTH domain-containing protein n=1 Tax=Pseudocercospora musae TaxID=113226 RepID=A0A139H5N7_9PEZI|nr:hypothetical protein AC579_8826 [Pseudocercospora musae]